MIIVSGKKKDAPYYFLCNAGGCKEKEFYKRLYTSEEHDVHWRKDHSKETGSGRAQFNVSVLLNKAESTKVVVKGDKKNFLK